MRYGGHGFHNRNACTGIPYLLTIMDAHVLPSQTGNGSNSDNNDIMCVLNTSKDWLNFSAHAENVISGHLGKESLYSQRATENSGAWVSFGISSSLASMSISAR